MLKSILGTKVGMTQIFDQAGNLIPVTVISAGPCVITAIRTKENDGYSALQVGLGEKKEKSVSRPLMGQFKKNNLTPKKHLREFRVADVSAYQIGQEVKVEVFQPNEYVDVTGTTIGRGYAGGVKRYNFKGGPTTHGQSDRLRAPGSLGGQRPQRVFRGQRMAGHLGDETVTIQKIRIVSVDPAKNILMLEGAVPGVKGGLLVIRQTVKTIKTPPPSKGAGAEKKKAAKK